MEITIHDIIDLMKSDPQGISVKFGVPLRTVYGWCNGWRTPPAYVLLMMKRIIDLEGGLADGKATDRLGSSMEGDPKGKQEAG